MTEQAYHARGAGRAAALEEVRLMLEEQRKECLDETVSMGLNRIRADELHTALINLRALAAEPGADTGTTPSRDCVWIVEQNGAVHSVHSTYESAFKEEGENLRIGVPWQLLPWREAERGTTPPDEALRAAVLEEAAKICEARVTDAYRYGNREAEQCAIAIRAAATQRVPVEHGDKELQELELKWRKLAEESLLESSRIHRTIGQVTEAETNCVVRAEVWKQNADEISQLRVQRAPVEQRRTQPVAPNVPLDGHIHKPGEFCAGCYDLVTGFSSYIPSFGPNDKKEGGK